ncbi:hypothetical protein BD309DRAFT_995375 [Dichomitus squalens]|uniref:Uncharacterized protein n=1 Tax=Dichomitus squalens TaxID=114155 RepID=A0A4Q9PTG3_9APHY|nr:hypothetical protein BD309DRAFT_995375 [Dichomitus squalens]TBU57634.1 hypothetical protein BD310DRAFT_928728 [Dichomitus squalens]
MSGTAAGPFLPINLHAIAAKKDTATREERRALHDAVQRRQFVEDMMELKGTFFPGLDALRKANEAPESSVDLKERIQEVKQKHLEEVRTLYEWQAQDYFDEVLDMSRSKPDVDLPDVEEFYRLSRSSHEIAASFDDQLDRHHYAHLTGLYPLMKQYNILRGVEEERQKQRDKQFPSSIAEFRATRNKDVQLRFARFLTSGDIARERMNHEYGWAWRQVMPLINDYNQNEEFQKEIQALLQSLSKEVESRDPRKSRLTATAAT